MNGLRSPDLLGAAAAGDNDACECLLEENSGLIWSVVLPKLPPTGFWAMFPV